MQTKQRRRFVHTAIGTLMLITIPITSHAQSVSCTSATDLKYVPATGRSIIGTDSTGARLNCQYFYWNKAQRMEWLRNNADSTFELDTFFYNYDGTAYGLAPYGAWSSNMPYPYVDTQFGDPEGEKAVTIGTANAQALRAGNWYYYSTQMTSGSGAYSWYKVSAQRGRRVPASCYSTFCSFGCSTESNNVKLIPFGGGRYAPECRDWWYKWDVTIDIPCY